MISAILGRIAPYLVAALVASCLLNWWLGSELLDKTEQLGGAHQAVTTQAVKDALVGSEAVRVAQRKADQQAQDQLRAALAKEGLALGAKQHDLDAARDALADANRRLTDELQTSLGLRAFLGTPIPGALLAPDVLCYFDGAGYSAACGRAGDPVRGDPGGR